MARSLLSNGEAARSPSGQAISRVGLLPHPGRPGAPALAEEIAAQLRAWGVEPLIGYLEDVPVPVGDETNYEGDSPFRARLLEQDLLIALGGDGSLLRLGHFAGRHGVPMLGINLGRLGFLSEVQPHEWREVLRRVLDGDYWLEERAMLRAEHLRATELRGRYDLLNDVVVGRGYFHRPVRLHTSVDGAHLSTYMADGLIVATATGSTAYGLAVGGPILAPSLRDMLLLPIAPHMSLARAVVLGPESTVTVEVGTRDQALYVGDGTDEVPMADGDRLQVRISPHTCHFVRVQDRSYFFRTLLRRMGQEGLDHE